MHCLDALALPGELQGTSICAYCARMKRGLLYSCCRKQNCNVLVLAQHLDDMCESFVMSAFHNGALRTMSAHYTIGEGDLRVIRPLAYAREAMMRKFSQSARLPVINENCPACFEAPQERHRVKKMLQQEESVFENVYSNLRRAMLPLMDADTCTSLREAAVQRKKPKPNPNQKRRQAQGRGKRKPAPPPGEAQDGAGSGEAPRKPLSGGQAAPPAAKRPKHAS